MTSRRTVGKFPRNSHQNAERGGRKMKVFRMEIHGFHGEAGADRIWQPKIPAALEVSESDVVEFDPTTKVEAGVADGWVKPTHAVILSNGGRPHPVVLEGERRQAAAWQSAVGRCSRFACPVCGQEKLVDKAQWCHDHKRVVCEECTLPCSCQ